MDENDASKKGKQKPQQGSDGAANPHRFRILHWSPEGWRDEDGNLDPPGPHKPTGTPQEIARVRRYLRWLSLNEANNDFGWFGVALIWMAISLANALSSVYRRLYRVLECDKPEDPTLPDVIALGLIQIGPELPLWLQRRIRAWDDWRRDFGIPEEYRDLPEEK